MRIIPPGRLAAFSSQHKTNSAGKLGVGSVSWFACHSGPNPRRIGTAAVAGHFDEYSTYQELAARGVGLNAKVNYRSDTIRLRHHGRSCAMNSNSGRTRLATIAGMLVVVCAFQTRSAQSSSATTSQTVAKPLLLEKDEGERRIWREPPPGDFILKVSPKNNSSQHLVMGTEDMHPGDEFPMHKHLGQDEILYIVKGTVHAHVGGQNAMCTQEELFSFPRSPG